MFVPRGALNRSFSPTPPEAPRQIEEVKTIECAAIAIRSPSPKSESMSPSKMLTRGRT